MSLTFSINSVVSFFIVLIDALLDEFGADVVVVFEVGPHDSEPEEEETQIRGGLTLLGGIWTRIGPFWLDLDILSARNLLERSYWCEQLIGNSICPEMPVQKSSKEWSTASI